MKHIILHLLIQDMKHEQLLHALRKAGFKNEVHDMDLSGVVCQLMGIPETDMTWEWSDTYMRFMRQARQYEITGNTQSLQTLAESCYGFLLACSPGHHHEVKGR